MFYLTFAFKDLCLQVVGWWFFFFSPEGIRIGNNFYKLATMKAIPQHKRLCSTTWGFCEAQIRCPEITSVVQLLQLTKTSTWKQTGLVLCSLFLKLVELDPITNLTRRTFLQLWCSCMEVVELFFFSMAGKRIVVGKWWASMPVSCIYMYI